MDIYASDDEKGEEIKQWWRDNGRSVIIACVATALAVFGGRYWVDYKSTQALKASHAYQQVSRALANGDSITAAAASDNLFTDFSTSPYSIFSAFDMASNAVKNNDNAAAQTYLNWVVSNADLSAHKELAQLRLAQVLFLDSKFDEALLLADKASSGAFSSLWSELKGDIYIEQAKPDQARTAYQQALFTIKQGEPRQQILQIKLDDVVASNNG